MSIPIVSAQDTPWRKMEGPASATITSFVETQSGELWAGTLNGLVVSENGGQSWKSVENELDPYEVWSLVRGANSVLYAATTEGLFHSEDNGGSWEELDASGQFAQVVHVAPVAEEHLFAATDDGIYLSEDAGLTWEIRNTGIPDDVFVTRVVSIGDEVLIAATGAAGVYRSVDQGLTWEASNSGLSNQFVRSMISDASERIWVGTNEGGVFVSEDQGLSWSESGDGIDGLDIRALIETDEGLVAGASTGNEEGVFGGLYRLDSGSSSWSQLEIAASQAEVRSLFALEDGALIAGTSGQNVFKSENGGDSWQPYEMGIRNSVIWNLYPTQSGRMYIVTYKAGFNRSSDAGESWESVTVSPNQETVFGFAEAPNGDLFLSTDKRAIYRSQDDGVSWEAVLPDVLSHHLKVTPTGTILVGGAGYIYRSEDNGEAWERIALPVVRYDEPNYTDVLNFVVGDQGEIFTAVADNGFFRSDDDGKNWTKAASNGLEDLSYVRLVRTTSGRLLLSYLGSEFHGYDAGILVSDDEGDNWRLLAPMPEPGVLSIFSFDAATLSEDLYVVANFLNQETRKWIPQGYKFDMVEETWSELPFVSSALGSFAFDAEGYLYAGTFGDGLYRSIDVMAPPFNAVSTEQAILGDDQLTLEQNYPNPFVDQTMIRFRLPESEWVALKVYDLLGREISTLMDGIQPAGQYELAFDADKLPAGVYYYQLATSTRQVNRSMILGN